MSKNVVTLIRAVCLATATTAVSSCFTRSGNYPDARSSTRSAAPFYSITSSRPTSIVAPTASRDLAPSTARTNPQAPAAVSASRAPSARRSFQGIPLFSWIFRPDRRNRNPRERTRRESRETRSTQPQRPVVPATKVNDAVLARSNRGNTRVVIDVADQKAYLLVNDTVAVEAPVSTGRPGKSTPRGTFRMGQRVRSGKISTIYGVAMPYWMRLGGSVYGVHAGYLPGYPASAGCIRLPSDAARLIFDNTLSGTRVNIYSSWNEYGG